MRSTDNQMAIKSNFIFTYKDNRSIVSSEALDSIISRYTWLQQNVYIKIKKVKKKKNVQRGAEKFLA